MHRSTAPRPTRAEQLSDVSVAGDPLALPHLAPRPGTRPETVAHFSGLALALAADRDRWAPLVRYDPVSRWYHRLDSGPGHEVWLLSWLPGQGTGRHDHGRSCGLLTVLTGTLTELVEGRDGGTVRHHLRPGSQRVFGPGHVHETGNDTLEPVVSLHVYFPGLTEMNERTRPGVGRRERRAERVAKAPLPDRGAETVS
ncbi:cysteine dioxygenase [Wenjunlia vitaminophila]|uniref:Cysteine dioxygenase n=1 Tax=Wenjunlia vitaminophila TaxID=76728 RepID=A0A0T6LRH6_WENVI|nr:hypothetical protein [Wenjunlia vitaminophila]KRV48727.1 cysteine dioxygenase [Wenjunlia vitaminophila]